MLGTRTLRDRSASRTPNGSTGKRKESVATEVKEEKMEGSAWLEPPLAQKPSYRDHAGVSYYGVSEHMQPLGEAPNARVKTRVKAEGARKSVLGRSAAGGGLDAQETPEGTPAPQTGAVVQAPPSPHPRIVVDDEDDADYAPKANGKKKERKPKPRAPKRQSETPAPTQTKLVPPDPKSYDRTKLGAIVNEAKMRALESGKPDLAAAVYEIYLQALKNGVLMRLMQAILAQKATPEETKQFQQHVRVAKKMLKEEAEARRQARRDHPHDSNGTHSLPLRSPSDLTPRELEIYSARTSTETSNYHDTKVSLTWKSPSKDPNRHRTSKTVTMSASPSKRREGSPNGSDSSLTDMTSNPDDDMDLDEPASDAAPGPSAQQTTTTGKDHAAERGSLTAPNRNLKRSSAEAELQEDERDLALAAKKQKLNEGITRDAQFEESSVREPADSRSSRLRARQSTTLAPPTLSLNTSGTRMGSRSASRAVSTDLDSPLSTPASSRQSTPQVAKAPAKAFGKKAKTKQSPEKKQLAAYGGMPGARGAGRESPADDDNEELSENNDFCSACGGSGYLLCCDGCDRSFHFACLDPPLNDEASELNEPWYCYICVAKRPITDSPEKPHRGLFAPLFNSLRKLNPSNFALPQDIRDYFEGVATDKTGSFVESVHTRTRNRPGYSDEPPDFTKIKDGKGKTILCYSCGKSSGGSRPIIPCDFCGEYWHLDCMDPPRSNPPARNQDGDKVHDWMCPLHSDHELRKVDTSLLNPRSVARKVHIRKPRNAKVVEASMKRGFHNNGVIDVVVDDESDGSDSEFYDEEGLDEGVVYRLPASGIKLDFIDKVKNTRVQQLRSQHAYDTARAIAQEPGNEPGPLEQANFAKRSFRDKKMALNLAQFASENSDLTLGADQVANLVGALIAEAPGDVVDGMTAAENAVKKRSAGSTIPPSPPVSEQTEALTAEQRKELEMLQELIRRRLAGGKT
ncbi:uncharacterized protein LTR77_005955 [Saxophila tyrrhenica]|uniref:PHD-type domain-containing protein n=1 Tax=Saxophila tyrrhenica TaxID=1690608 RepID=A0AAV9P6J6_9PEZI|nr:hypothetical protein LTR77_005955 [Saxophila tyrrhenica]